MNTSRRFWLRIRGEFACFTRPEMKVERVSYPVITPPAAIGVLESILWKPSIAWQVHTIFVLKMPTYINFRRNEIKHQYKVIGNKLPQPVIVENSRTQRNTLALRDVDYAIEASFSMTPKAHPADDVIKFTEMFLRRMSRGQYFRPPFLGCREFPAIVEFYEGDPKPVPLLMPLGMVNTGVWNENREFDPKFSSLTIDNGIINVPQFQG